MRCGSTLETRCHPENAANYDLKGKEALCIGMLSSTREMERNHECDRIGERCALRYQQRPATIGAQPFTQPGQDIYREASHHAWQECADDARLEEIAHRVGGQRLRKSM